MASVAGVFFDLYGTLFLYDDMDSAWASWLDAFHAAMVDHGVALDRNEFGAACDGFFTEPEPGPATDGESTLELRIARLGARLGVTLAADASRDVATRKVDAWQRHIPCDPDTRPVLEALRARGCSLTLISNFDQPPHIHALLARHGLDALFDHVIVSADVGVKKPDPSIFQIALERTGHEAGEVIHVGDTSDDVDGAAAAGIRAVLIERDRHGDHPAVYDYRHGGADATRTARRARALETATRIRSLQELLDLA